VLKSVVEHRDHREPTMTQRMSGSIFSWLTLVGVAVPPRDPNDDEDDEEDDGDEGDDSEPAVVREPDED
jgi:hypothetical protein